MGQTKIEWTATVSPDGMILPGFTFNGWIGCTMGCEYCYACRDNKRYKWVEDWSKPRLTKKGTWNNPIKWNKLASDTQIRRKVFAFSLGDVFDPGVPNEWREKFFETVRNTQWLDWLVLTKQIDMARVYNSMFSEFPNVWLGVTIDWQSTSWRAAILRKIKAAKRFVSLEPMKDEPIYMPLISREMDWLIIGGESGGNDAAKFHIEWAEKTIKEATPKTKIFVKQIGSNAWYRGVRYLTDSRKGSDPSEWPKSIRVRYLPDYDGNLTDI